MTDKNLIWKAAIEPAQLAEFGVALAEVDGQRFAIYDVEGEYYATADLCSHGQAFLSEGYLEGDVIECPLHQGLFNVRTGEAVGAPCTIAVATYPVKCEDNMLYIGL